MTEIDSKIVFLQYINNFKNKKDLLLFFFQIVL